MSLQKVNDTTAVRDGYMDTEHMTNKYKKCFVMKYDSEIMLFRGQQSNCDYDTRHYVLCQMWPNEPVNCQSGSTTSPTKRRKKRQTVSEFDTKLDSMLNPVKKAEQQRNMDKVRIPYG